MSKWSLRQCSACVPASKFCQNFGRCGNKINFVIFCTQFRKRHRFRFKDKEVLQGKVALQSELWLGTKDEGFVFSNT